MSQIKSSPTEVRVLVTIGKKPERKATRAELGVRYGSIQEMINDNLVKVAGYIHTGKPGRPEVLYGHTEKGRKRYNRIAKVS